MAKDALKLGFRASLLWDRSRLVTPDSDATTRATLHTLGIAILQSDELLAG